jgi:hypothetical protein
MVTTLIFLSILFIGSVVVKWWRVSPKRICIFFSAKALGQYHSETPSYWSFLNHSVICKAAFLLVPASRRGWAEFIFWVTIIQGCDPLRIQLHGTEGSSRGVSALGGSWTLSSVSISLRSHESCNSSLSSSANALGGSSLGAQLTSLSTYLYLVLW